jgi:hypothetical protein
MPILLNFLKRSAFSSFMGRQSNDDYDAAKYPCPHFRKQSHVAPKQPLHNSGSLQEEYRSSNSLLDPSELYLLLRLLIRMIVSDESISSTRRCSSISILSPG